MTIPSASSIAPTVSAVEQLNRKYAAQSELLSGLGTKVQDWGKNTQWAGRQMTVGITVPFAMAAAAAGKYAMEIDKDLTRIEKVYDGSTQGLREQATNFAMNLTRQLGVTVQSTLEIMGDLAAAGKQGQEMYSMTTEAQRLSVLGDVDKEESIKAVISMSTIFGLTTKDLANSINYLNAVDAKTPTSMKELADAIPIAGATVKQLGGDLKDTTVLLAAFKERGISTVEGANAIKSAMNRVLSPTKAAQAVFQEFTKKDINKVIKEAGSNPLDIMQALSDAIMGGNIALEDQQRIISKLFGTYQSTRITGLLTSLQDKNGAVAEAKALSAKSDGELRSIAEKHEEAIKNSASRQFTIAVESFKSQLKEFGDFALKVATVVIQGFSKVFDFFNGLPGPIKAVVIGLGLIAAVAGPIVMMAGLFANLLGSVIKFGAFIGGLRSGYKSMTVEQKAAELSAGNLSKHLVTEADSAQILIYQMEKLRGAIQAVDSAQTKAAATPGMINNMAGVKVNGNQIVEGAPGVYRTNTGKDLTESEKQLVAQQLTNREKQKTVDIEKDVADQTEKSGRMAKAFSSETLVGVGAAAGVASMVTETGSGLEKWLTWISLGSVAFGALLPVISKVGTAIKGMDIFQSLSSGAGMAGKVGGFASKIGSSLKTAFTSALSFMKTPAGLGIGAALAGVLGVIKLVSAEQEKQEENHQSILHSTDDWTKALGRNKIEWGQIKNTAGEVKDTQASLAEKMKKDNADMVKRFQSVGDMKELQWMSNTEVTRLQGQGMNQQEITDAMSALLRAAGKKREEIETILSNIKVSFDFNNSQKDFDGFMSTIKKKVGALQGNLFGENSTQWDEQGTPAISGDSLQNLNRQTEELASQFRDRMANMSDVDRAVFAKKFADSMAQGYTDAFQQLNSQYGGKLGKDWQDARAKFMSYDVDSGDWQLNDAGKQQLPADGAQKLVYLAKEEADLTKAIAKANGATDDQVKKISVMSDIMPYLTQGLGDSTKVQESYNNAVKAAEAAGHKMTDEEKMKLAAIYAGVSGLDAARLSTNGYAQANTNSAEAAAKNAEGIKNLVKGLKDAGNAGKDMWDDLADPEGGFAALGGNVQQQASTLTDKVKQIYSGTMDNVYQAYADSAQEIWQQRLDNITKSFERRKDALQKQISDFDKAYENKQQAFNDRWDATMEASKKSFDDRQKAIENEAQGRIDSIDAQIDAIKNQQDAEQELEQVRQKQFEAEKQRIERMAELANRNIDYNRALYGGNLDEAARVQNNTESLTIGWSIDDANSRAEDRADAKSKMSDKQIQELEGSKELVNKQKQAKLDALKEEEDAVTKSLEKQRESERRSMEIARDIERQRLQDKLDSLGREQQAAEAKERKLQEMNKRTLDIQLATLKAFIPQNEQQLNDHINRVGSAYGQFGLGLQGAGSMWGQIVGNALQNNVDIARQQMSSDANWSAFGAQVAGAISQGAFGLNLNDFMNLLRTGNVPQGWAPPSPSGGYAGNGLSVTHGGARHAGGPVDDSPGSRNARGNSPLGGDEMPMVLQRGEFVINKAAVQTLGTQNLSRINAGQPMNLDPGVGFAGEAGGFASVIGKTMASLAVKRLADHYAAENSQVAMALGYMGQGLVDAISFAQAQDGKPYIWTGVGPQGYDCSGYMSAIANVLTGQEPHHRIFGTGQMSPGKSKGPFQPGLGGPFEIGVKHGSPGHTAGTLNGVNVESTGNHVRYGKDAHGATDPQFNMFFHVPPEMVAGGGFGSSSGGGGPVKDIVRGVAQRYGWEAGAQWDALDYLISHESSWNPNAQNPGSTAYGLFQFLTNTWSEVGMAKTSDPRMQTEAGLKYVKKRYRDPIGAANFWRSHHWYDGGGELTPGDHLVHNGTNMTESVLNNGTTRGVINALKKAAMTYSGFNNVIKDLRMDANIQQLASVDSGRSDTYNYTVQVNGSELTKKELTVAVSEAIDRKHVMDRKKRGEIK